MVIVLGNGRGNQPVRHELPLPIQQPADGGHIPDYPAPDVPLRISVCGVLRLLHQIIAQGIFAPEPVFQLGPGGGEMRDHAVAGQQHQRHAGVERHPGGGYILQDVEFLIIRPMQGAAAQPDQHHAVGYLRLHQQGGRYVGDGPDRRHVQGIFSGVLHGQLCQRLCRIGWNGRFFIGQIGGGAPVDRHVFPGQRQQFQNFLIAFLHAVGRAGGTLIMKGRGAQRQQMQPVLRA